MNKQTTAQWNFFSNIITHPVFWVCLFFIIFCIFIILLIAIKKGYNIFGKNVQIAKSNSDVDMTYISNNELDIHFGGVEKLKDDNNDKQITKIFQQYRSAVQETKNITDDMASLFIETFTLENLNEHYQAFNNITTELKFELFQGMLDVIFNNHLTVNEEQWEYKKSKITRQLMNIIKRTIKKDFDNNKLGISWEIFDSKFFNQNQLYLKRELENFIEELKRLTRECNEKIVINENNIKIIKKFYQGKKQYENINSR